jgi:hypothetical protein
VAGPFLIPGLTPGSAGTRKPTLNLAKAASDFKSDF